MYNKENYIRLKHEFEKKHFAASELAEAHTREVEARIPELSEINSALRKTGYRIYEETMRGGEGLDERLEEIHRENRELQSIRQSILEQAGLPRDYLDLKYDCPLCDDTGFTKESRGRDLCICMKRALILAGYESSGIGRLMQTQRFDTFSLGYYPPGEIRAGMERIYNNTREFACGFSQDTHVNLFFWGNTGLGKTHISTSIAVEVINRGYDVVYDTVSNIIMAYEAVSFGRAGEERDTGAVDSYTACDLLIIDDLGTEMNTQFTVNILFNLLNTRLNNQKSTVISSNLDFDMLKARYGSRIVSRLLGEFRQCHFTGSDVRMERLRGRNS